MSKNMSNMSVSVEISAADTFSDEIVVNAGETIRAGVDTDDTGWTYTVSLQAYSDALGDFVTIHEFSDGDLPLDSDPLAVTTRYRIGVLSGDGGSGSNVSAFIETSDGAAVVS